jgi:hypothetical protein
LIGPGAADHGPEGGYRVAILVDRLWKSDDDRIANTTDPGHFPWSVQFDPTGDFTNGKFNLLDLTWGVVSGVWEEGTIFIHRINHRQLIVKHSELISFEG